MKQLFLSPALDRLQTGHDLRELTSHVGGLLGHQADLLHVDILEQTVDFDLLDQHSQLSFQLIIFVAKFLIELIKFLVLLTQISKILTLFLTSGLHLRENDRQT